MGKVTELDVKGECEQAWGVSQIIILAVDSWQIEVINIVMQRQEGQGQLMLSAIDFARDGISSH